MTTYGIIHHPLFQANPLNGTFSDNNIFEIKPAFRGKTFKTFEAARLHLCKECMVTNGFIIVKLKNRIVKLQNSVKEIVHSIYFTN